MKFDYSLEPGRKLEKKAYINGVKPLISIVTPFYNAGKYFLQTCYSVLNQSFPWFEWIIVNDGSTDANDIYLLEEIKKKDCRIQVICQENGGLSAARNTGFKNAAAEIVVPLDADDLIEPGYLESVYWALYFNPDADWCYTDSVGFFEEEYLWENPWDSQRMKVENILVATAAIRKKAFFDVNGYRVEKYPFNEDWCFWLNMLAKGKKPVHVSGYGFWYRRSEQGMLASIRKNAKQKKLSQGIIQKAAEQIKENVAGIEYPVAKTSIPYHTPEPISLGEKYIIPHGLKKRILYVVSKIALDNDDIFNLGCLKKINKDNYEITVVVISPVENSLYQQIAEFAWDVAVLPNFLDPAYNFDYLCYYIQSRSVDLIIINDYLVGYYMTPLIKKYFPSVPVLDPVSIEDGTWRKSDYGNIAEILDEEYVDCVIKHSLKPEKLEENVYMLYTKLTGEEKVAELLWQNCLPDSTEQEKRMFIQKTFYERRHYKERGFARKLLDLVFPINSRTRKTLKTNYKVFLSIFQSLKTK